MGKESKVLICGDVSQSDLSMHHKEALPEFISLINGIDGVGCHVFTKDDTVRNKLLIEIIEKYENWKISSSNKTYLK